MATDIISGGTPGPIRPGGIWPVRVQPSTLTGTYDVTLCTLPAGTIITGASMAVIRGDTDATTSTVDIEIGATGAGDTTVLAGGADFTGTAGAYENTVTEANLGTINAVSIGGSDLVVNAEFTYSGAATVAPIVEVYLELVRSDY